MLAHDAVNFLVSRIQEQSKVEGIALSDLETKMLRWSEVEPDGIHDLAVVEEFETQYDSDEYEAKISGLLRRAREADRQDGAGKMVWDQVSEALARHDYYLIVMLDQSSHAKAESKRSTLRDQLIYLAVGIGIVAVLVYMMIVGQR